MSGDEKIKRADEGPFAFQVGSNFSVVLGSVVREHQNFKDFKESSQSCKLRVVTS